MKSGSLPIAPRSLATGPDMVLSKKPLSVNSRVGKQVREQVREVSGLPEPINSASIRLDQVMSKTGADGTEDPEIDPHEQTETRTRAPAAVDDDSWDIEEPVATKVATIPPPAVLSTATDAKVVVQVEAKTVEPKRVVADEGIARRVINPAKFPSAMVELAKSEPKIAVAVVESKATKGTDRQPSSVAPKDPASVANDENQAIAAAPIITLERGSAKSEGKLTVVKGGGLSKSEGKLAVAKGRDSAKSESKLEAIKADNIPGDETRPSNAGMKAARARQESLLSLESEYVVEFFSSPPASISPHALADYEPEVELTPPPRSLFPAAELKLRRRHFRSIVVKVMLVALALFAFSLYVFWRRGLFEQVGF